MAEGVLEQALELGEEGRWEEMADLLREALADAPDDPFLLCWLGVAEREMGLDGVAYERFKRCLALQPEDPHVLATAGNGLAAFDDPDAEAALRAAALLGPGLVVARWLYGAYLSREGHLADALRELDAATELDPDDPAVALERGVARSLSGDLAGAVADFARSAELDPGDGWVRVILGLAQSELGEMEDAAANLDEGARLRPEDLEAQLLSGLASAAEGWDDRAFEMVERARQRAEGGDAALIAEVEERVDEGPDAAREALTASMGPMAFRARIMTRP